MKATLTFTSQVEQAGKLLVVSIEIDVPGVVYPLPVQYAKELLVQIAVVITNPEELEKPAAALASPEGANPQRSIVTPSSKLKRIK